MQSIQTPDLVVQFADFTVGVVVNADDRYAIGFKSEEWTSAANPDMWKVKEFNLNEPLVSEAIEPKKIDIGTKYHKIVKGSLVDPKDASKGMVIDIYDVLSAFDVRNPALQHAVKKLLMPGLRGHKSVLSDMEEAHNSVKRAIELEEGKSIE